MIKVENIDIWGFEHAIRGMRNPMNSWDKSDSKTCLGKEFTDCTVNTDKCPRKDDEDFDYDIFCIGKNDLDLMRRLYKAGTEHRKYLRQIFVSMDITAPLYWWKEFDTYKFILPDPLHYDSNSCSTMHKIAAKEFEIDDFSHEHLVDISEAVMAEICRVLNTWRSLYLESKNKEDWWQLIQLLPSSYNQKRTITMNYENAVTMIKQRNNHKLDEWREFVKILFDLPHIKEIMIDGTETR